MIESCSSIIAIIIIITTIVTKITIPYLINNLKLEAYIIANSYYSSIIRAFTKMDQLQSMLERKLQNYQKWNFKLEH